MSYLDNVPSVKDLFNGYVKIESAKVNARMSATAPLQNAGLNNPGRPQNPQAKVGPSSAPGMSSKHIKELALGMAALGLLLVGLKATKVI